MFDSRLDSGACLADEFSAAIDCGDPGFDSEQGIDFFEVLLYRPVTDVEDGGDLRVGLSAFHPLEDFYLASGESEF